MRKGLTERPKDFDCISSLGNPPSAGAFADEKKGFGGQKASDYISHLKANQKIGDLHHHHHQEETETRADDETDEIGEPKNSGFSFSRWGGQLLLNAKTRLIDWKKDQVTSSETKR